MTTEWVEKELLFAGATETKLWWLVTGDDGKTYQVEVSGIQFPSAPVWQIEQQFANSVAKVSVPCGAATEEKPQMTKRH